MTKVKFTLVVGIFVLAGCTDTMDSITREYRNANNEVIDAMMMITSEEQAIRLNARIFKPIPARYKAMDDKLKIFAMNRATNLELVKEVYESDGVHLYLTDMEVNRVRFKLEMARLRNLHKQYVAEEQARRPDQGDPKMIAPTLYDIVHNTSHSLVAFEKQLLVSDLETRMKAFGSLKGVTPEKLAPINEVYKQKRAAFALKQAPNFRVPN